MNTTPRRPVGRPTLSDDGLLDVALDLFLEHGFEGTSLDAITSAAGMAKRTLYARHADKETLFRAALKRAIEKWIVPVERLRAAETDDLGESLHRIGDILLANIMSREGLRLLRLTNAVAARMPDIAATNVAQGTEPTLAYLTGLIESRLDLPRAEASDAATAFLHLVVGGPSSMAAWGVPMDQVAVDRHARAAVRLFLQGLLPRGGAATQLEDENRRLRRMLTDALLENEALRERRE